MAAGPEAAASGFGLFRHPPKTARKPAKKGLGYPWILLDSFVRIETYQWLTGSVCSEIIFKAPSAPRATRRRSGLAGGNDKTEGISAYAPPKYFNRLSIPALWLVHLSTCPLLAPNHRPRPEGGAFKAPRLEEPAPSLARGRSRVFWTHPSRRRCAAPQDEVGGFHGPVSRRGWELL
jgi:hypothetical protein